MVLYHIMNGHYSKFHHLVSCTNPYFPPFPTSCLSDKINIITIACIQEWLIIKLNNEHFSKIYLQTTYNTNMKFTWYKLFNNSRSLVLPIILTISSKSTQSRIHLSDICGLAQVLREKHLN